jgi:predicted RNA binding protein YcfA (HicA-like mRNA interferase family)
VGWVEDRTKGDHLVMTKPGMARPVVIKMDRDLGEDIIRNNMRTAGVDRAEFERLLNIVRRRRK